MHETPESARRALRQKLKVAEETYEGYASAIADVKNRGETPPPELIRKEADALRRVSEISRALLGLVGKG